MERELYGVEKVGEIQMTATMVWDIAVNDNDSKLINRRSRNSISLLEVQLRVVCGVGGGVGGRCCLVLESSYGVTHPSNDSVVGSSLHSYVPPSCALTPCLPLKFF